MHYYQHHIGDFTRDTANLTDSQLAAYLRMLWIYYDTELPLEPDPDAIAFRIRASASDVAALLKHYFSIGDDGKYHNTRGDKEIKAFHAKSETLRNNANARWSNAKALPMLCKSNANQEPITKNQEVKHIRANRADVFPEVENRQVVDDWLIIRKTKKLAVTKTALSGFKAEVDKSGLSLQDALTRCCHEGWGGFKASWLTNTQSTDQFAGAK